MIRYKTLYGLDNYTDAYMFVNNHCIICESADGVKLRTITNTNRCEQYLRNVNAVILEPRVDINDVPELLQKGTVDKIKLKIDMGRL
jgi:hypothetical protein